MSTREELIGGCNRILWIEQEMKKNYSSYKNFLKDKDLSRSIEEIENDEIRHINMVERILSILQK